MIGIIFKHAGSMVEVIVDGSNCVFRTQQLPLLVPIDSIRIDKAGSIKEHPDLKGNKDWKKITIERFKEKLKKMKSEKERIEYLIKDLSKFGYEPQYLQRQGHRPIKLKGKLSI